MDDPCLLPLDELWRQIRESLVTAPEQLLSLKIVTESRQELRVFHISVHGDGRFLWLSAQDQLHQSSEQQ
jgi:hypothetical protein